MKIRFLIIFLIVLFLSGCSSWEPRFQSKTYHPYHGLTIKVKLTWEQETHHWFYARNKEATIEFISTDENSYKIEIIKIDRSRFHYYEEVINNFTIGSPQIKKIILRTDSLETYYVPFNKINCYMTLGKNIEHKRIDYEYWENNREKTKEELKKDKER
jgi:uncharacterized protein YceK